MFCNHEKGRAGTWKQTKSTRKNNRQDYFFAPCSLGRMWEEEKNEKHEHAAEKERPAQKRAIMWTFFSQHPRLQTHTIQNSLIQKLFSIFFPRVSRRVSLQRGAKPTRRNSKKFFLFFSGINIEKHSNLYLLKAHKQRQLSDYRYTEAARDSTDKRGIKEQNWHFRRRRRTTREESGISEDKKLLIEPNKGR